MIIQMLGWGFAAAVGILIAGLLVVLAGCAVALVIAVIKGLITFSKL